MSKKFLFSIDLEDVRNGIANEHQYEDRVELNTIKYLNWLRDNHVNCTFFVTGHVAKNHPKLIEKILSEGHEVACHTNSHIPLNQFTPESFYADIQENIHYLRLAGATSIKGFRAPVLSMTEHTSWVYDILYELGFSYSSSVLPAKNPLYGWSDFGESPKLIHPKILEIPVTIGNFVLMKTPVISGIYFRLLPDFLIRHSINKNNVSNPIVGYFHPYDIDHLQERFMMSGIENNRVYNRLMYLNRKNVLQRLQNFINNGLEIDTYINYVNHNFRN